MTNIMENVQKMNEYKTYITLYNFRSEIEIN